MKLMIFLVASLLCFSASAVEISQNFRGTGEWSSSLALGTASSDMSGQGRLTRAGWKEMYGTDGLKGMIMKTLNRQITGGGVKVRS